MHASPPTDTVISRTRPRLTGLRHLWVFATITTIEVIVATFLFDTPRTEVALWQDLVVLASVVAKVAIGAFCLLFVAAWPRRAEMMRTYQAFTARAEPRYYLVANIALFAALIAVRLAIPPNAEPPAYLLAAYALLLLSTGASLAFLLAPPAFWWRLLRVAPAEIAMALTGGSFVLWLGNVAQQGWTTLASATLTLSHWFLTLYEPNVLLDAEKRLLGAGDFSVRIDAPCSGYEGVALIITFLSVYLWVFRRELRFPNALLLLPIGIAAIWTLNALRIAALVSIGAHVSPDIAIHGFHSQAGWISFLFVTLAAIALAQRVPFFSAQQPRQSLSPPAPTASAQADLTLPFLAPFMAMLVASILASAFAPHDHWFYAVRVVAIAAMLWWFRDIYRPLITAVSWSSVVVGLAVGALWIATDPERGQEVPLGDWIADLPAGIAAAWLMLRAFGSVALVPVAEELAFRGFLARWLVSTRFENVDFGQFRLLAFVGSSLAFGFMHERWLAAALAGAAYALLMYRTRRLSDPIVAHAASNLAIVGWAVAAEQWSLL